MITKQDFLGYDANNIYLDNAASTLALKSVADAGMNFLQTYGSIHRGAGHNSEVSTNAYEKARTTIHSHIDGAQTDDVIFTGNTTEAINMLAHILSSHDGEILISDIEHSSNAIPWRTLFTVNEFQTNNGRVDSALIDVALTKHPNTQLVACTWASNVSGYITDMEVVYQICKKHNVFLLADASQYAPHFRPSLNYCDFLVYCGHKMNAPFSTGVLAGRHDVLNAPGTSPTGGGNIVYTSNIGTVYKPSPWMHEAGTPNGIGAVTIAKAHNLLYGHVDALKVHNEAMNKAVALAGDKLREVGYDVWFDKGEDKTPTFLISAPFANNKVVVRMMNSTIEDYNKNVFCREGTFCAYNMLENVRGIEHIKDLKKAFTDAIDKSGTLISQEGLPKEYSFIRLSAGLINDEKDIEYATEKLRAIAKFLQ